MFIILNTLSELIITQNMGIDLTTYLSGDTGQ